MKQEASKIVATVVVEQKPGKRTPLWARTAYIDSNNQVFLPAALFMNEQDAMLCACYDGTSLISQRRHAFLPSQWIAKEVPSHKQNIDRIVASILKHHLAAEPV